MLGYWAFSAIRVHRFGEAIEKAARVLELAGDEEDIWSQVHAAYALYMAYRRIGDAMEAECADRFLAVCERLQDKQSMKTASQKRIQKVL